MKSITFLSFPVFAICVFVSCGSDDPDPEPPEPPTETDEGFTTPLSYDGLTLVWNDEFDGNSLNSTNWSYDIGTGCPDLCGWGNQELQYYRAENVSVNSGKLLITARDQDLKVVNILLEKLSLGIK